MDVLCVGQLAADILVRPVDRVDYGVDTRRVEGIDIKNGGDCLNVALGLAKLGGSVGFAGLVGDDQLGDYLRGVIEEAGIDARGLATTAEARTCSCLVLINSAGRAHVFLLRRSQRPVLRRPSYRRPGAGRHRARRRHLSPAPIRRGRGGGVVRRRPEAGKAHLHGRHLGHHGPVAVRHRAVSPAPEPVHAEHPRGGEDRRNRRSSGDRPVSCSPKGWGRSWSSSASRAAT